MDMRYRVLGIFFLLLPFLPLESFFGLIRGIGGAMDMKGWVLSLSILLPSVWFLSLFLESKRDRIDKFLHKICSFYTPLVVFFHLVVCFLLLVFINQDVFSARPLLIDSVVQLFQAEIFAEGRIKTDPHPFPEFFMVQHVLFEEGGWYSQYPPGHSFMLSLAALCGASWIMPPLLGAGSMGFLYLFSRRVFGKEVSVLVLYLMTLSPFFIFMSGSFMNHVSSLFFLSGFLYFFQRWEHENKTRWILCSVLFGSAVLLIRPLTAVAFCAPFVFYTAQIVLKERRYFDFVAAVFTSLIAPFILLWYQLRTTGDAFLPGYLKLWGKGHGLGFHESPWGEQHSILHGLRNELGDLRLLQEMLFEYPFPALWLIAAFLVWGKPESLWFKRLLLSSLLLPLTYLFYWHRDAYLGPRFLYESIACFIPLTAYCVYKFGSSLDEKLFYIKGLFFPVRAGTLFRSLLLLSVVYALTITIPQRYMIYKSGMASIKKDILEEARSQGIKEGIIFIKESWGSRLFAEIRGYGISASLAQKAYSTLDHCLLQLEFNEARNSEMGSDEFSNRLVHLLQVQKKVPSIKQSEALKNISQDKTLRLDTARVLDPLCRDEIRYDQTAFGIYYPFIRLNKADFSGGYLFVRDLRERNKKILDLYPGRQAYLYAAGVFTVLDAEEN